MNFRNKNIDTALHASTKKWHDDKATRNMWRYASAKGWLTVK